MKSISILFLFFLLCYACTSKSEVEVSPKDTLIQQLLDDPTIQYAKNKEGKLIVLTTQYCEITDCKTYFKPYADNILLYSKADIFMRNLQNYIEIVHINEQNSSIQMNKVKERKYLKSTTN